MSKRILVPALLSALFMLAPFVAGAAEEARPAADATAKPFPPEEIDRDGKHIAGYALMTESERAGYRSTLHFLKTLPERDAFRKQHYESMAKRAKAKNVPLGE